MPKRNDIRKILILGAGPALIGQAGEFDDSAAAACKAIRRLGFATVVVDSNPATLVTDPEMADVAYIEPLNPKALEKIIVRERPDALLATCGGLTAFYSALQLAKLGVLERQSVRMIGVQADAIERAEDRQAFKNTMAQLGISTPRSEVAWNLEEAERILQRIDLPCMIRPAYTFGGAGGGLVYNSEEFRTVAGRGLSISPAGQISIEESLEGWQELELEILRDAQGRKIKVCGIENIDPMGVHAGDSWCAIPMITTDASLEGKLERLAYAVADAIGVVGGAGIRFAHDLKTGRLSAVALNPRASRSSVFASKATGLPVASISALLACGLTLDEIPCHDGGTLDRYWPRRDFVALRGPRWAFDKFQSAEDRLGAEMRSVGEALGIGQNFKEALQKLVRSLELGRFGLGFARDFHDKPLTDLMGMLWHPTSERLFILYEALRKGGDVEALSQRTGIKPWYLGQLKELGELDDGILACRGRGLDDRLLGEAKRSGFSDRYLAELLETPELEIRSRRKRLGLAGRYTEVRVPLEDAAFCYSSYNAEERDDRPSDRKKALLLGAGPVRIGQGGGFDYCSVHAARALRSLGWETIIVNCNPAAASTDYDACDRLYVEPPAAEDVLGICDRERPDGVIVQFGGRLSLPLCREIERHGIPFLGTPFDKIELAVDRDRFRGLLEELGIPHPPSGMARSAQEALQIASRIGYPILARPVQGIEVLHDAEDFAQYLARAPLPVFVEKFLENALEAGADALSDGDEVFIPAVMEHIELAGIHSGDSACVLPPVSIPDEQQSAIGDYTRKIARALEIRGLLNVEFAIAGGTVFVLKARPRVSRTVPLVSKVCSVPMVRHAAALVLGTRLADLGLEHRRIPHCGVKEAVFPFSTFPEVDPVLGPEMRSTGEVLGLADSFELAFYKAQEAAGQLLPQGGTVLISVSDADKPEALGVASEFARLGFQLKATEGTQAYLSANGVSCEKVFKINAGRPDVVDCIKNGETRLVLNTPIGKRGTSDDSCIRKAAIQHKVSYVTTMAAARAAVQGIAAHRRREAWLEPLQREIPPG